MEHFKAGKTVQQGHYRSFEPSPIDHAWTVGDMEVMQLLGKADRELGRLDMYSDHIPNLDLFINMHVLKEATQSSKIEGTQTTIEEALLGEEDIPLDRRNDWEEVQNYIKAMRYAIVAMRELPFSSRLIREAHRSLMQGVRGEQKQPGAFRTSQNWIGGANISQAIFVPPVHTSVPELMGDLEKFAHNEEIFFPELLRIALIHYQFETIHPFLDGNGRVGRLMITLYLVSRGILKSPVLYLSDFLERNRRQYYENLMLVREKDDLSGWFKFFLQGIIETAQKGILTFNAIMKLQNETDQKLQTLGSRMANAKKIINHLYQNPLINAEDAKKVAGVSSPSAYALIKELENLKILTEMTGGQRSRMYSFKEYINLYNN